MKACRFPHQPNRGVGHPCPWCGVTMTRAPSGDEIRQTDATLEHVIPRCRIGSAGPKLFVCRQCNHIKGDLTLDEFAAKLPEGRLKRHFMAWARAHAAQVVWIRVKEAELATKGLRVARAPRRAEWERDWIDYQRAAGWLPEAAETAVPTP